MNLQEIEERIAAAIEAQRAKGATIVRKDFGISLRREVEVHVLSRERVLARFGYKYPIMCCCALSAVVMEMDPKVEVDTCTSPGEAALDHLGDVWGMTLEQLSAITMGFDDCEPDMLGRPDEMRGYYEVGVRLNKRFDPQRLYDLLHVPQQSGV